MTSDWRYGVETVALNPAIRPQTAAWELLTARLTTFTKNSHLYLNFASPLSFGMIRFQREVPVSFLLSLPSSGAEHVAPSPAGARQPLP